MKRCFLVIFAVCILVVEARAAEENGKIEGIVLDEELQSPLSDVTVEVKNTGQRATTNQDGKFVLETPYGEHEIIVTYPFYHNRKLPGIQVAKGLPAAPLRIALAPQVIELASLKLAVRLRESSEAGLLEKRRLSFAVEDNISTELMSKLPVSDAGDALKRVTGISIVEGRYVYVRGLGERYSNTLLNNVEIPSPEPNRRVVPMDIFPADLLESLQTVKTFSPNQPGNFAGGSVQVFTKDFPEALTMSLSMSTSFNTETTGENVLDYPGGNTDVLGYDYGTRELPEIIQSEAANTPIRERGRFTSLGFTQQDIQRFGRAFDNVWSPERKEARANQSYKFNLGNSTRFAGKQLGYLGIISYSNGLSHRFEERNTFRVARGGILTPSTAYDIEKTAHNIGWGGVLNTSMRLARHHKISLRTLYSQKTEDQTRTWSGFNSDRNTDLRNSRLLYVERGLFSGQLAGDHEFASEGAMLESRKDALKPVPALNWRLTYSRAMRAEPDTREMLYEERDGVFYFRDISQSGSRFFFDLTDDEISGRLDFSVPLGAEGLIKIGGLLRNRDRTFDARRFRFEPSDNVDQIVNLSAPAEELFKAEHIAPRVFELRESTRATDNYLASHTVWASYAMVDIPLMEALRLTTGARLEVSDQNVTTFDPLTAEAEPIEANLDTTDVLPSLNLTYRATKRMNLRLAASRTLTRPDLREMAPFEFTDFIGGRTIFGNPNLARTQIDNYDLRWEFFQELGGVIAVSGFYKKFRKPIEQIVQPAAEVRITYENAKAARNFGIELELRQNLSLIHSNLEHFSVNTNAALVSSEVKLPDVGIQTSAQRTLQGQSPYVVNATLGYDNPDLQITGAVAFHVFGRRIDEVGNHGIPDVYEQPRSQLDVTMGRRIGSYLRLNFSARNLLNPDVTFLQGDETYVRYRTGRTFSFGISYNL